MAKSPADTGFKMVVEWRDPQSLTPYFRNAKRHPTEQIDKIAGSIAEFKFDQPIVIDPQGVIIKGHGRREAAIRLGIKEVPVVVRGDLSETQVKAARIADNRVAESPWDDDFLKLELADLKIADIDLALTGFDENELRKFDLGEGTSGHTDPDNVPDEKTVETRVKIGDLWEMGGHRLLCGDCTDKRLINILMADKKANMVFTDPPYGMFLKPEWDKIKKNPFSSKKGIKAGKKREQIIGDHEDFRPELITSIFEFFGYCEDIFLWGADYFSEHIPSRNYGSWIVWDKRLEESADKIFGSCFELCWSKARHKRDVARIKWAGVFGIEKEPDKKRFHPTQKPVALAEWFISRYSEENQYLIDPFLGSGSTLIACEKTGHTCYGMEIDPHYCDIILKRWEDFTGRKAELLNDKSGA